MPKDIHQAQKVSHEPDRHACHKYDSYYGFFAHGFTRKWERSTSRRMQLQVIHLGASPLPDQV